MILCYISFYLACSSDPGIIKDNYKAKKLIKKYAYDNLYYTKNNECNSCKLIKPARSKHCKACDVCVEKFDHHCIWINNCVGKKNHKYFLFFLSIHTLMVTYGVIVGLLVFFSQMKVKNDLGGVKFYIEETKKEMPATISMHFYYFFSIEEESFGWIFVINIVLTVCLWYFLGQTILMIWNNETTNETYKY